MHAAAWHQMIHFPLSSWLLPHPHKTENELVQSVHDAALAVLFTTLKRRDGRRTDSGGRRTRTAGRTRTGCNINWALIRKPVLCAHDALHCVMMIFN